MTETPSSYGNYPYYFKLSPEFFPFLVKTKKNTSHQQSFGQRQFSLGTNYFLKTPYYIFIIFIIWPILLGGCTVSYIDSDGFKHILGFADVSFQTSSDSNKGNSQMVGVTNIGFLISRDPIQSSFSFGYNREAIIVFKDDSCTWISPSSFSWINNLQNVSTTENQKGLSND